MDKVAVEGWDRGEDGDEIGVGVGVGNGVLVGDRLMVRS